ncbi:putative saccharopine dehydrogenase-like oxidoreductase-like [Apostichopus japonicus]|uniref:Putative saccharopine dehydrogenase-like oxidoreductase-like n=1 Tax=Stichopus japonicus TaxID=307972 RepID=A0A2G8LQH4_STIJA|nr:putative saccharopine dehydrogenase-like oxidoreductase-like [Apostichopus japonicus]
MKNKEGLDLSSVEFLPADVKDDLSLTSMCQSTKLVLNCVGPYRFFGEAVVKACVENGSHHIDISGEPWFLESMEVKYNQQASEAGVYVVGACGFDSIPAEFGVQFTREKFPGILNSLESYLSLNTGPKGGAVNFGTWHSAIYGFANAKELVALRKENKKEPLPKYTPKLSKGADASVVRRSQGFSIETKKKGQCINGDLRGTCKYSCVRRFVAAPYGKSPGGHMVVVHYGPPGEIG